MTFESQLAFLALDAIDVPVYVVDRDYRYVAANRAYRALCRAANLDPAAPVGFLFGDLFPAIADRASANFAQVFNTGEEYSVEDQFEVNGKLVLAEIRLFPIRTGDTVSHVAVIAYDVTERRALETAARDCHETALALMNASSSIMMLADNEGKILNCNEPGARWFGRPADEVIGRLGQEIAPPEWVATVTPYFVDVLFNKKPSRFQFKSGDLTYDAVLHPILDDEGQVTRFAIFATDITHHAEVLESIRVSEERFRLQFESIPVPTYIYEKRGDDLYMVDFNPAAVEFTRGGVQKFLNMSARQQHAPNPTVIEDLFTCVNEHKVVRRQFNYSFQLSPRVTYVDAWYVPIAPDRVLVHTVDLTEHRAVVEELRLSQQAYRDLVENVNDVIYSTDRDGVITYVSPAIKRVLGYDPPDVVGQPVWPLIHPDDVNELVDSLQDVLDGKLYPSEYRLRMKSGEYRWVQTSSRPIMENGTAVGLRGVMVDIALQKEVEEKLREAQRELEARVESRTEELARANDQLQIEQDTLRRKNLVLQELVAQIEASRHHAAMQILANIERVVLPIFGHLEGKLDARSNRYVALLKQTLSEITAPFTATLESAYHRLTPVEIEICNLIRLGYGSKEIAEQRHSSVQTVVKQRKVIRRKLGIGKSKTSLAHHLSKLQADSAKNG